MIIDVRAHHLSLLAERYFNGVASGNADIGRVYDMISAKPDEFEIRVVEGYDYLCDKLCNAPLKGPFGKNRHSCLNDNDEDKHARNAFGVSVEEKFGWNEILERFEEFRRRTGASSPRALYLQCKRYSFEQNKFL